MSKLLFNDDNILSMLHPLLIHISHTYGVTPKQIAQKLDISPSYFYSLRNLKSSLSIDAKKEFFINLLQKYGLSIRKDENGDLQFIRGSRDGLYTSYCYLYLYEKENYTLRVFNGKIDLLSRHTKFENLNSNVLFYGRYSENIEHTSWSLKTKNIIGHYNSEFTFWDNFPEKSPIGKDNDVFEESIRYDINLSGHLSSIINKPVFGFFTRAITYSKIFSGRVYISDKKIEELPNEIMVYLSNQKFHEYFNHNVQVQSIDELKPYIEEFQKNVKLIQLEIPEELVISYQQFLSFFSNYVEVTKGKAIKFDVLKRKDGLTIDLELLNDNITMPELKTYINEYLAFAEENINDLRVNIESDLSPRGFDIFILELKQQINNLKQSLEIANLKNNFLQNEGEYLKQIVGKFAEKEYNIHFQLINGGEQQFADKIKNHEN